MPQVNPWFDKVLVNRIELPEPNKEKSLIELPDSAKEKPQFGIIIAVGDTKYAKPEQVVLFGKYSGIEFNIGRQEFLILREEEIIGDVSGIEVEKVVTNG